MEEKTVRKEVEYGLFGSESPPRFKLPALVYLRVIRELGLEPTVAERKKIYRLIAEAFARSKKPTKVEVSPVLELKLDEVIEDIERTLERFEDWKQRRVVVNPKIMGGEPVFPKSRLTVRHVGRCCFATAKISCASSCSMRTSRPRSPRYCAPRTVAIS